MLIKMTIEDWLSGAVQQLLLRTQSAYQLYGRAPPPGRREPSRLSNFIKTKKNDVYLHFQKLQRINFHAGLLLVMLFLIKNYTGFLLSYSACSTELPIKSYNNIRQFCGSQTGGWFTDVFL